MPPPPKVTKSQIRQGPGAKLLTNPCMAQNIQLLGKIHQSFSWKHRSLFSKLVSTRIVLSSVKNRKVCPASWKDKLPSQKNKEPAGHLIFFKGKHILVQFCVFSKSVKINGGSAKSHKVETIPINLVNCQKGKQNWLNIFQN